MEQRSAVRYNNLQGVEKSPMAGDAAAMKKEFARRLQAAMIRKGWNQSELARRANAHLPKPTPGQKRGKSIGRDNISHWIRGDTLPTPTYLEAVAAALGVPSGSLMPFREPGAVDHSDTPIEMVSAGAGRVYLRLNRTVSQETALKIMGLLAGEDKES